MESIPGYDGWKLSTPWDDEIAIDVSFECSECEAENLNVEAVTGKRDTEVYVSCDECGEENVVDR
jgi:transcription elongation factor Elf1